MTLDPFAADDDERTSGSDRLSHLFAIADDIIDHGYDVMPAAVWVKPDGTVCKAPLLVRGHLQAHHDRQLIRS